MTTDLLPSLLIILSEGGIGYSLRAHGLTDFRWDLFAPPFSFL